MSRWRHWMWFKRTLRGGQPSKLLSRRRSLAEMLEARWLLDAAPYVELNLVANQPRTALITDPSLGFAMGISTSGGVSVSDTLAGRSNAYSGDVAGSPFVADTGQDVKVPSPTGQVFNGNTSEFYIISPPPPSGMERPTVKAPAELLYASLDGTIYGFNSEIGPQAVAAVSVPKAVFTGITIANNGTADQLYAVDLHAGKIDVFNTSFSRVSTSGSFTDPKLPAGDVPFNIEALGGDLYVSYVAPERVFPTNSGLPVGLGPGGVVDAFDANGNFLGRIASGSSVDGPWGMAIAPASFGRFAGDLLVANHGDGTIRAFDPAPDPSATTGTPLGTLSDANGNAFVVDGLWGLSFGNGDNAGDAGALYFSAGTPPLVPAGAAGNPSSISPLSRGLVGSIQVGGTSPLVADGTDLSADSGKTITEVLAAFGSADTASPTVTPAHGTIASPVASYTATIDWGDGSSSTPGTVVSTGDGGYLVIGTHTYTGAGSDHYTVTIHDAASNSVTATGTVQVTAATLVAHGQSVHSQGLTVDDAIVATFVDRGGSDPIANYTATINWGDGASSAGTIVAGMTLGGGSGTATANSHATTIVDGSFFGVQGSHVYAAAGDYTFTVAITDSDGSQVTVTGTAEVMPATLAAKGLTITGSGLAVNNGVVADFIDTGGSDPLTNYTATIDWGDGSSSTGTVSGGSLVPGGANGEPPIVTGAAYSVTGSHDYTSSGKYTTTITIHDSDGTSATVQGAVDFVVATLQLHPVPIESRGLTVANAVVADFDDTGGADPISNYSATIDWGDGVTSAGTIGPGIMPLSGGQVVPGGLFDVTGSHTYASAGTYTVSVSVNDTPDGIGAGFQETLTISPATLEAKAVPVTSGLSVNATVANFTDTDGGDPLTNYSATIDWGDGTPSSTGTVSVIILDSGTGSGNSSATPPVIIGGKIYEVEGNHTYAATGAYTTTITITDTDGTSATATGSVSVSEPTLHAQALSVVSHGLNVNNAAVADFYDDDRDPLANYSATIDWGDGTSASAGTIGPGLTPLNGNSGIAFPLFDVTGSHSYAATGTYTFTVTISDTDGSSATVTGTVDVTPAMLEATAVPVVSSGLAVNATLANFVDTDGGDPLTNYSATINWGDGTPSSTGTITAIILDSGTGKGSQSAMPAVIIGGEYYSVEGSHTYAATGDYTATITVSDTDGTSATVTGTVSVSTPTLEATAIPVSSQGLSVKNAVLADFTDTGGADPLSNYSATINWGDGSSSTGTIGAAAIMFPGGVVGTTGGTDENPGGPIAFGDHFDVSGTHSYASAGTYTFTVAISDTDGTSATVTGTVTVATATLEATAIPVSSQGLSLHEAVVAEFVDTGGADPAANYTATINWGDNSTSTGTILLPVDVPPPGGRPFPEVYHVAGSHTYAAAGDYTFTVTISDTDGTSATVTGTASVATPTLEANVLPVYSSGLTLTNTAILDFADTGGADPVANYTATINWGDNSSSTGTIDEFVADPPGMPLTAAAGEFLTGPIFQVAGSHTYAAAGDYTLTVTITDSDGTSTTVTGTASVAQAPLLAVGVPVVVNSGLSMNNAILAALTDAAGGDSVSNYSATIDWGDGSSTSAGTVTGSGNSFVVNGSHTYAASGNYQFTVSIADGDGSTATVTAHAYVDLPFTSYVANAFEGVLHRAADDSGLGYWGQQLAAGLAPSQFASDLTHSAEFYATNVIQPAYQQYLGRSADSAGVAYWTSQMQQGLTDQQIEANFIASDEFYAKAGGTNADWVNAMYQAVLGRPADSAGLSYWLAQLASGVSRSDVAMGFAASQEREGQLIQQDYFTYLGRSPSADEINYWVAQFDNGATNEDIVSGFVGSPEYVKLHS